MALRTYWSLAEAFGTEPKVLKPPLRPANSLSFVLAPPNVFPSLQRLAEAGVTVVSPLPRPQNLRLCTDNWPFLYLETNRIPRFNLLAIMAILVISCATVLVAEPSMRRPNLHFFFLGAGFMLLETRSITQLSLLFGSTWHVTAFVVCAILSAVFVTNMLVMNNRGLKPGVSYLLLFCTLAGGFFFPFNTLLAWSFFPRLLFSTLLVGLPFVWAGFIFSNSFRQATRVNVVFGSNLLGVVLGAALEYTSNVWGLNLLYLIAMALYCASLVCLPKKYMGRFIGAVAA
jgi:hypothetical protein